MSEIQESVENLGDITVSMSQARFRAELARERLNGISTGHKNLIEVFNSFVMGVEDKIEIPSSMNPELKKQLVDAIETMRSHFNKDEVSEGSSHE